MRDLMKKFKKDVAPVEVIRKDFAVLRSQWSLRTTNEIQDLLFMQSIEGRSHQGTGYFNKRNYVNTTIDDVVKALNRDTVKSKEYRQSLINDITEFVDSTINGNKLDRLMNAHGEPFLGIPFFKDLKINARDVLRGLYLGGLRDNADIRKETEARYQINIGCGECYLVDVSVMTKMHLNGERLAHEPHEDKIADYVKKGLIVETDEAQDPLPENLRYYYIRHRLGPGQSDDAAIVIAGVLFNVDVALGVFLSDAIDTLEKYAPVYKDQDQELSYYIGRAFQDLQITMDDVYELAYLCAIPEAEEELVPDSSLRYLIAINRRSDLTAIESHLKFVKGEPVPNLPVSFKQIPSTELYNYIKRRLVNVRRIDAMAVPDLSVEEMNRPLGEIAQENFLVVNEDQKLSDVIQQFKLSKAEIIIVVAKNNKVIGTLTAADLIYLSGSSNGS